MDRSAIQWPLLALTLGLVGGCAGSIEFGGDDLQQPGQPATEDLDEDGVLSLSDCDDTDPARYPGAEEVCDGVDNDCDDELGEGETDDDGDGVLVCDGDCDDSEAEVYPGAEEVCDGLDTDCDEETVLEGDHDGDGDMVAVCAGDCDDTNQNIFPGAEERCNGQDDDCDGALSAEERDTDGDDYTPCDDDCDDTDPTRNPGVEEVCDGLDNDCDGELLDGESVDGDGDGVPLCGDCDDTDGAVFPGAGDYPGDGLDTDCDGLDPEAGTVCFGDGNWLDELPWSGGRTLGGSDETSGPAGPEFYVDDLELWGMTGMELSVYMEADFDAALYLLDQSCTVVASNDDSTLYSTNARINFVVPSDGVYTVLSSSGVPGATGGYDLSIQEGFPVGTRCGGDEWVVDSGAIEGALNSGDDADGLRGDGFYFDDFEFEGVDGQQIELSVTSGNFDTYLYLLDQDCNIVVEDDDSGSGTNSAIDHTLDGDGVYTIMVTSWGQSESGEYDLVIDLDAG